MTGLRFFALFFFTPLIVVCQTVSDLSAYHANGQTFLTWKAPRGPVSHYVLFRSARPIRTSFSLRDAERIGSVQPGQSVNHRLQSILRAPQFFRLPNSTVPLTIDDELVVLPSAKQGQWYYAVAIHTGRTEITTLTIGRNTTPTPVFERPGNPLPVFQRTVMWEGRNLDVFVHWVSNVSLPRYPAMANVLSLPFNFAVAKQGNAPLHPLFVRFHGRGDHFLRHVRHSGNPQEWVLAMDDYLPGEMRSTFWFGYHENMNIWSGGNGVPSSGTVMDYTAARIRWTIEWACRALPIDTSRITLAGYSMGASGAVFTGLTFPERIASVIAHQPRLNYAVERDPNISPQSSSWRGSQRVFQTLWGNPSANLPTNTGLAVYERQNFNRVLAHVRRDRLPPMLIFAGRNDTTVGWMQMVQAMRTADSAEIEADFFWDLRAHERSADAHWMPFEHAIYRSHYRSDRSYPAVVHESKNADPGTGSWSTGDTLGSMNASVESVEPVIDEKDVWSCGLSITATDASALDLPPSLTATVLPKRLQEFTIRPNVWYVATITTPAGRTVHRTIESTADGAVIIRDVPLTKAVTRVDVRPVAGPFIRP